MMLNTISSGEVLGACFRFGPMAAGFWVFLTGPETKLQVWVAVWQMRVVGPVWCLSTPASAHMPHTCMHAHKERGTKTQWTVMYVSAVPPPPSGTAGPHAGKADSSTPCVATR